MTSTRIPPLGEVSTRSSGLLPAHRRAKRLKEDGRNGHGALPMGLRTAVRDRSPDPRGALGDGQAPTEDDGGDGAVTVLWRCCDGVVTAASLLSAHSGDPLRPPKAPATVREIHGRMPERYAASMPRPIPSAGVRPPTDRPCYSGTDHPTSRTTGSPEDRFMAVLACPLCLLYSRQCPPNRGIRKVLKTHGNPIPISRSYGAGRIRN